MSGAIRIAMSGHNREQMLLSSSPKRQSDGALSVIGWAAGLFFAVRTVAVFIAARWLNVGTEPGVLFTFTCSAALVSIAALQAFGPSAQPLPWIWEDRPFRWAVTFLALSGASLTWTAAASPSGAAMYWTALAGDVILVLLVIRGAGSQRAGHSIMNGFVWGSCILAGMGWTLPAAEDLRLGDLEYLNTNQIGNLCALAIFLCLLLARRTQGTWRLATIFLTVTLFRSLSKATLVAFVASQAFRLLVDRGMSYRSKVLLMVGAIALTLAFWGLIEAYADVYNNAGNQAETLTGRTAIWAWTVKAAAGRPWLGNGIDAMWKVAPPFGGELFEARHAENELLQQFFAYGIAGVYVLMGLYMSLWRRFRQLRDHSERSILTSLMVFIVVRGMAEAEPFDLLLPLWMVTALSLLVHSSPVQHSALASQDGFPDGELPTRSVEVTA